MKLRITRPLATLSALLLAGALVGCAQSPIDEQAGRHSTRTDAQEKAQGQRDRAKHPSSSQLAIPFGSAAVTANPDLPPGGIRELYEARTFSGTIPCAATQTNCIPVRFTVTFSPNGVWRMRATETSPGTGSALVFC